MSGNIGTPWSSWARSSTGSSSLWMKSEFKKLGPISRTAAPQRCRASSISAFQSVPAAMRLSFQTLKLLHRVMPPSWRSSRSFQRFSPWSARA